MPPILEQRSTTLDQNHRDKSRKESTNNKNLRRRFWKRRYFFLFGLSKGGCVSSGVHLEGRLSFDVKTTMHDAWRMTQAKINCKLSDVGEFIFRHAWCQAVDKQQIERMVKIWIKNNFYKNFDRWRARLFVLLGDQEALQVNCVDHAVLDFELGKGVITFLRKIEFCNGPLSISICHQRAVHKR